MMIGKARDLRQMRHTDDLIRFRQKLQSFTYGRCRRATDARVHFIKHKQRNPAPLPRIARSRLQSKRDAREFAAGGNLF